MLKVSQNPPARWPEERSLFEDLGRWGVLRVKPRHEKALAWELKRMGIGYYLPMMTKRTIRRDTGKPRKSIVCLFPGYLAVTELSQRKAEVFRTGRVLRAIQVEDQERFVNELENVRKALESCDRAAVEKELVRGTRVVIVSGPLAGLEGVVTDIKEPKKLYLNVELFNRAVSVSISPHQVAPVEEKLF